MLQSFPNYGPSEVFHIYSFPRALLLSRWNLTREFDDAIVLSTEIVLAEVEYQGYNCGSQSKNLGNLDLAACSAAASRDAMCHGYFMWSAQYWSDWGCRCCSLGKETGGSPNSNWDIYFYGGVFDRLCLVVPSTGVKAHQAIAQCGRHPASGVGWVGGPEAEKKRAYLKSASKFRPLL